MFITIVDIFDSDESVKRYKKEFQTNEISKKIILQELEKFVPETTFNKIKDQWVWVKFKEPTEENKTNETIRGHTLTRFSISDGESYIFCALIKI